MIVPDAPPRVRAEFTDAPPALLETVPGPLPPDRQAFYEARSGSAVREQQRFYHQLVERHYRFLIPEGARVLEVGCGVGNLLAALKPSRGVGVDFSPGMIAQARAQHPQHEFLLGEATQFPSAEKFDYIVLSDLVNDHPDVQLLLERLQANAHPRTRLILNFFNQLWRPILSLAEACDLKAPTPPQNWLSLEDMRNLLGLAGWECVRAETRMLAPVRVAGLEALANRWLAPVLRPLCLTLFMTARPAPRVEAMRHYRCSVVIPARNEGGNIEAAVQRIPELGKGTEIIFIEGGSTDHTWEEIQRVRGKYGFRDITILKQEGRGKGSAVRQAFEVATGDILFILDADLTVPPESLRQFYEAIRSGRAEFVNGVRLVYPMQDQAMQFLNMIANKTFGVLFSWLMGQPVKDTLCGTKVLFRKDYELIAQQRKYFGEFDPFGDFDLLFGAAKLNLRIVDLPVRYQARTYGSTNIHRWRHGWLLLRMVLFAARRLKFVR